MNKNYNENNNNHAIRKIIKIEHEKKHALWHCEVHTKSKLSVEAVGGERKNNSVRDLLTPGSCKEQ